MPVRNINAAPDAAPGRHAFLLSNPRLLQPNYESCRLSNQRSKSSTGKGLLYK